MKLAISLAAAIFAAAPSATGPGMNATLVGIGLICGAEDATPATAGAATGVMLPGMGNGTYAVDTANPDAAAWFNHALRLWKDADAELKPEIDAVRSALQRLATEL